MTTSCFAVSRTDCICMVRCCLEHVTKMQQRGDIMRRKGVGYKSGREGAKIKGKITGSFFKGRWSLPPQGP